MSPVLSFFFFFNDTATTEIYTLSLHDALPILPAPARSLERAEPEREDREHRDGRDEESDQEHRDRKSTRLNSSHGYISYAVFCLKKKKNKKSNTASNDAQTSKQKRIAVHLSHS